MRAGGQPATRYLFGSAAPWIRAWHYRAKVGGAARVVTSTAIVATSDLYCATMHGAAQALGHARAIGVVKSVS